MEPPPTRAEGPPEGAAAPEGLLAAAPGPLPLEEVDRRVIRFAWLERRRFELLGGWAVAVAELEVKALLATQAHHHAWHASLWEGHRPRRSGHRPGAGEPVDEALRVAVEAVGRSETTVERLVGSYRVLGRHAVAAYTRHLDGSNPVSDAAVARTCRLVLADQLDDWRRGEAALERLLATGDDVARAGAHQVHLERLLLAAGGYAGVSR